MTTLDAYRLRLLQDMRLALPVDLADEHNIWEKLDEIATYGESAEGNFRYVHPKTP